MPCSRRVVAQHVLGRRSPSPGHRAIVARTGADSATGTSLRRAVYRGTGGIHEPGDTGAPRGVEHHEKPADIHRRGVQRDPVPTSRPKPGRPGVGPSSPLASRSRQRRGHARRPRRSRATVPAGRFSRRPLEKSSSTRTPRPCVTSRSTVCEPMKPAPPVIRIMLDCSASGGRRLSHGWIGAPPRRAVSGATADSTRVGMEKPRFPEPAHNPKAPGPPGGLEESGYTTSARSIAVQRKEALPSHRPTPRWSRVLLFAFAGPTRASAPTPSRAPRSSPAAHALAPTQASGGSMRASATSRAGSPSRRGASTTLNMRPVAASHRAITSAPRSRCRCPG